MLASGARSPFDYHRVEVGDVDELVKDCTLPRKRLSVNVNMTCRKPISGSCREMSIRPPELEMLFNFPNFSQYQARHLEVRHSRVSGAGIRRQSLS